MLKYRGKNRVVSELHCKTKDNIGHMEMEILLNNRKKLVKPPKEFTVDSALMASVTSVSDCLEVGVDEIAHLAVNQHTTVSGKVVAVDTATNVR